ncbi:MAG: MBL fold metallo-hydrolase [Spirochaetales bacterium]|nr:MBL fold metallo-hydrolase [Spirochaetales bacterium]
MIFYSHFSTDTLSNCYVIGPDNGGNAIIIDPGMFDTVLLTVIEENNLYLKYILVTHSHDSHIRGIKTIKKIYNAQIYSYRHSILEFKSHKIRNFMKIDCGDIQFEVLETPGHTGDSITYRIDRSLFTGDALFAGTIGSVSDGFTRGLMIASIKDKLFCFDDDFLIFPGHGSPSKLGIEKRFNPDLQEGM